MVGDNVGGPRVTSAFYNKVGTMSPNEAHSPSSRFLGSGVGRALFHLTSTRFVHVALALGPTNPHIAYREGGTGGLAHRFLIEAGTSFWLLAALCLLFQFSAQVRMNLRSDLIMGLVGYLAAICGSSCSTCGASPVLAVTTSQHAMPCR